MSTDAPDSDPKDESSMDMDISPLRNGRDKLQLIPNSQTPSHLQMMAVETEHPPISHGDCFSLNVNVTPFNDTYAQQTFTGRITMVVTARQHLTVDANNHSAEHIKSLAFKQLANVGVKIDALDIVSVSPGHSEPLSLAMSALGLGAHENMTLKMCVAGIVITNDSLRKVENAHQHRIDSSEFPSDGHLMSALSAQITTGSAGNQITHGPGHTLPLFALSPLPLGVSTSSSEPRWVLRSQRRGRPRARPESTTFVQRDPIARVSKNQKKKARREQAEHRDAKQRERFAAGARAEHEDWYLDPLPLKEGEIAKVRASTSTELATLKGLQARSLAFHCRRVEDKETIRWSKLGNAPSHEKKMEAIVKELRDLEA